jgi:hypothetical protein
MNASMTTILPPRIRVYWMSRSSALVRCRPVSLRESRERSGDNQDVDSNGRRARLAMVLRKVGVRRIKHSGGNCEQQ